MKFHGIAFIFFVGQDAFNRRWTPPGGFLSGLGCFDLILTEQALAGRTGNTGEIQLSGDDRRGCTLQKASEDRAYDLRFGLHNLRNTVLTASITHKLLIGHRNLAFGKTLAHAPGHIFGDIPAFLLGNAGHDCQEHFSLAVQRVDILFLKINLYAMLLQLADGGQRIYRVSGETGN